MIMKKSAKPAPSSKPRPQRRSASSPRLTPQANPIELLDGMWERIARKAYELWEQRGYREGHDFEDWLEAEAIVMKEIHEARE